jgi:hypothetical protein
MRLESGFLRSRIARRVFWSLLLAAALPLAVFATLAYGMLAERLETQANSRLQEAAKYAGMLVYDRLLAAQTALAGVAAGSHGEHEPQAGLPMAARKLFVAVAGIPHGGGAVLGSAEVADVWRAIGRGARPTMSTAAPAVVAAVAAGPAGAGGAGPARRAALVDRPKLDAGYLWGDLRDERRRHRHLRDRCQRPAADVPARPGCHAGAPHRGVRHASWSLFTRGRFRHRRLGHHAHGARKPAGGRANCRWSRWPGRRPPSACCWWRA